MTYTLKTNLANSANYGSRRNTDAIRYLVYHYTANDGDSDESNGSYFQKNVVKASAHYFVDDNSVTRSVPDDYTAWSVGGQKYAGCDRTGGGTFYGKCTNANSLSIELCDSVKNGTCDFTENTLRIAAELGRELMNKYHIPPENVIRHFDVNGKLCPAPFVNDPAGWLQFKGRLTDPADSTASSVPAPSSPAAAQPSASPVFQACIVQIVTSGSNLNVRTGPGAGFPIVQSKGQNVFCKNGFKYTVVDEENGWGLLKSYAAGRNGWIKLSYTNYEKIK